MTRQFNENDVRRKPNGEFDDKPEKKGLPVTGKLTSSPP